MKQYLSIILRNKFNLFYRFGYVFIPQSELIEFDGNITNETKESIVKQFASITPFEYDEEYLILHFDKQTSEKEGFIQFEIQDIVAIYPLSRQAKISIESKMDQRIKLENPVFETILYKVEAEIGKKEIEKSISALWEICKMDSTLEKYISDIGIENIFKGLGHRKSGTKANKIQNGNYWEYLIAYDRFDYFPNSTLGYFYDAGQVFAFCKGLPTFEGSMLHKLLEQFNRVNPTRKISDIINFIETEKQSQNYISQTTTDTAKQYIVTPLYLMLRDEIRNSDNISQTKLFNNLTQLKTFGDSFCYAIILLGAFFGFRKFYDSYYEVLNLRFYKGHKDVVEKNNVSVENKIDETELSMNLIEEPKIQRTKAEPKGKGKNGNSADISSQYRSIIEDAFTNRNEMKLTEIGALIKKETGDKITNAIVENIIVQIPEMEVICRNKIKRARRKGTILFNE